MSSFSYRVFQIILPYVFLFASVIYQKNLTLKGMRCWLKGGEFLLSQQVVIKLCRLYAVFFLPCGTVLDFPRLYQMMTEKLWMVGLSCQAGSALLAERHFMRTGDLRRGPTVTIPRDLVGKN